MENDGIKFGRSWRSKNMNLNLMVLELREDGWEMQIGGSISFVFLL